MTDNAMGEGLSEMVHLSRDLNEGREQALQMEEKFQAEIKTSAKNLRWEFIQRIWKTSRGLCDQRSEVGDTITNQVFRV